MGQAASKPRPGTDFKVIGAGLPRTGTASFSEALKLLLDGPVYHGGTQNCKGDPVNMTSFTRMLEHTPIESDEDKAIVKSVLQERFTGFAASTDAPGAQFVGELLELFPEAKVVCTVRDVDRWVASIEEVSKASLSPLLWLILLPLSPMRHFTRYIEALQEGRWGELYYKNGSSKKHQNMAIEWDNHMAYPREIVPADKLFFYDVRDGWEPLCNFLECEVPVGIEFPRINDGAAIETFAKEQVMKGLKMWALILGTTVLAMGIGVALWRTR